MGEQVVEEETEPKRALFYLRVSTPRQMDTAGPAARPVAEIVADYFAAYVLMPKRLIKAAFFGGIQTIEALADVFEVSPAAMRVRLGQLGLSRATDEPPSAAAWQTDSSIRRHGRYQRAFSNNWTPIALTEAAA